MRADNIAIFALIIASIALGLSIAPMLIECLK